jgi:hypothetical protein
MHTVHAGFSFVCRVKPEEVDAASALLKDLRQRAEQLFGGSKTTHFLSGAVLPVQHRGKRALPATLLFLTSYWGPTRAHLQELVALAGPELRALFGHCEGFPGRSCTDKELVRFMARHRRPDTFYSGMHNVTRQDVLDERALRTEIEAYVDREADELSRLQPEEVRARIQAFVQSRPELPASRPWRRRTLDMLVMHRHVIMVAALAALLVFTTISWWLTRSSALGVAAGTGWIGLVGLLLFLGFLVWSTREYEKTLDTFVAGRQPDDKVKAIHRTQLQPVINEMTVAGPIKDGWWRPLLLRIALWVVARYVTTARITIPTVATARWLAIDGGQRLIFVSNFTNMSEGYVRDFIDIKDGAARINLLFGWGHGYPTTELLYKRGAQEDSNGFIHVVNLQQHLTELWYCPYKDICIDNIVINRKLRQGLHDERNRFQAQQWLRLL